MRSYTRTLLIKFASIPTTLFRWYDEKRMAGTWLAFATLLFATISSAQDGKTILILDASGSMWGEITDGYKINVAQDVVNDLLETLPAEQELGLIAYGHRRKGYCSDIEMLVAPGPDTRDAISTAVGSLNPTGKTPLSAAVMQAADELRIEENPATVILVSDGGETCDLDPCAVGTELEQRGIDFTAHVVGFDVEAADDRDQLACLAENTGGQFIPANGAADLIGALMALSNTIVEPDTRSVEPSARKVESAERPKIVVNSQDNVTMNAPNEIRVGEAIVVEWGGPNEPNDFIAVANVGAANYINATATRSGSPLEIQTPTKVGNYELRYVLHSGKTVMATRPIKVIKAQVSLDAPNKASVGESILVNWVGPDQPNDFIAVAKVGATNYVNATYTSNGNPAKIEMPSKPGKYEIRYVLKQGETILRAQGISVR